MKQIKISEVLDQAWELTKKNWIVVLACMIGIYIITYIVSSIFGPSPAEALALVNEMQHTQDPLQIMSIYTKIISMNSTAAILSSIVNMVLTVGFFQTLLNCVRGKGDFTLDAWKLPAMTYVKIVIAKIIVGVICYIGCLFCILPGIYLYARLMFTTFYFLDHPEAGIGEALSGSWNMTQTSTFSIVGLLVIFFFLILLGLLCCCIGAIVAEIVIYLAIALVYVTLAPETSIANTQE